MEEGGVGEEGGWGNSRWWSTVRTYLLISPPLFFFTFRRGNKSIEEWDGLRRACFVNRYVGVV